MILLKKLLTIKYQVPSSSVALPKVDVQRLWLKLHAVTRRIETVGSLTPMKDCLTQQKLILRAVRRVGIFDHAAANGGFFDHRREFKNIHVCHTAVGMAGIKVAAEKVKLIFGGPGRRRFAFQVLVPAQDLFLVSRKFKVRHVDPRRQAGRTFRTGWPVQYIL